MIWLNWAGCWHREIFVEFSVVYLELFEVIQCEIAEGVGWVDHVECDNNRSKKLRSAVQFHLVCVGISRVLVSLVFEYEHMEDLISKGCKILGKWLSEDADNGFT